MKRFIILAFLFITGSFVCNLSIFAASLSGVGASYEGIMGFDGVPLQSYGSANAIIKINENSNVDIEFWFNSGGMAATRVSYIYKFLMKPFYPYAGAGILVGSSAPFLSLNGGFEVDLGKFSAYGGAGYINSFTGSTGMTFEGGVRYYINK